jgi:hypothetical protein
MRRKIFLLGGVMLVVLAACSGPSHHSTSPTSSPAPPTSAPSTVSATDPYAVPRVITVAYVNSVLAALAHVASNSAREFSSTHQVNSVVKANLRAIFNDPTYAQQIQDLNQNLKEGYLNPVRPGGGDIRITVKRLITASATCIFAETISDTSPLFLHPAVLPASEYFGLRPKQPGADPDHLNPTPWAFADDEAFLHPTSAPTKCASG